MSNHEIMRGNDHVQIGSDRGFGLVVGGILCAIAVYQLYVGSSWYVWIAGPGMALVVLGLLSPKVLHPLNVAWMKLGLLLGRIVTPVVMFCVYAISVVPTGLLLRVFGKDLLRLKQQPDGASYWIERSPPGPPPESLRDQF